MNASINKILATIFLIFVAVSECQSSTPPEERVAYDGVNGFKYHYEIYKSAAIVTWKESLDSTYCVVYSKDHQRSFYTFSNRANAKNRRTFVIPLKHFELEDFPLSVKLQFFGSNFTYTDNLTINL